MATNSNANVRLEAGTTSAPPADARVNRGGPSIVDRVLRVLSSVSFGITVLAVLLLAVLVGTLILQRPTADPERFRVYYTEVLMPAERLVYDALQLFDVYHAPWFMVLMFVLALNITLATIDRFPVPWHFYKKPRLHANPRFIGQQQFHERVTVQAAPVDVVARIVEEARRARFKPTVTQDGDRGSAAAVTTTTTAAAKRTTVFAERGVMNRFGFVFVHIALITTLAGGLMTSWWGQNGFLALTEGDAAGGFRLRNIDNTVAEGDTPLGFTVVAERLRQELKDPAKGTGLDNTINWFTTVRIIDHSRNREFSETVSVNDPLDYRGYRFFQSGFNDTGGAKQVTLRVFAPGSEGAPPQEVRIERNRPREVPGLGLVKLVDFRQEFNAGTTGEADSVVRAGAGNPFATLEVTTEGGETRRAFAFDRERTALVRNLEREGQAPGAMASIGRVGGWQFELAGYDPSQVSVLAVQLDPGAWVVYVGSTLLVLALFYVFYFAHERVWAVVEPDASTGGSIVHLGAHTNRGQVAFEGKFKKFADRVFSRETSQSTG